MNWIDFFVLFVLLVAVLNGYRRGLFKELTTFLGLVIGIIFAVTNADWLASMLEGKLNISPSVLYVVSFFLVFAAGILSLRLIGHYFYKLVKLTPLKTYDKLGGGLFGAIKGLVALSLIFLLFIFPTPLKSFDSAIGDSTMAKPIRAFVPYIYDNTAYLHPESRSFVSEVQKGILLSNTSRYSQDPEAALKDKVLLGMSSDDVETLDKLKQYFSKTTD